MIQKARFYYRMFRERHRSEAAELNYICEHLKPGMTAFDIGVYKGVYSYWMAKSVAETGIVVGFEPQAEFYKYMVKIKSGLNLDNYKIEQLALSDTEGSSTLFIPTSADKGKSWASLESKYSSEADNVEVPTTTLDTYCENHNLSPDLVKCDVEGHEYKVFRGAEILLRKVHPPLLFECEEKHLSEVSIYDIFHYLKSLGYEGFAFDKDGIRKMHYHNEQELQNIIEKSTRNFLFR
ncbi:MAG: FkbM family methyltransferase [Planctomycetota bacterium]|jgi:FkbM family methyltransferase